MKKQNEQKDQFSWNYFLPISEEIKMRVELIENNTKNQWIFTSLKKMSPNRNSALSSTTLKDTYANRDIWRCLSQSSSPVQCIFCCQKSSLRMFPEKRALSIPLTSRFCTQPIQKRMRFVRVTPGHMSLNVSPPSTGSQNEWFRIARQMGFPDS